MVRISWVAAVGITTQACFYSPHGTEPTTLGSSGGSSGATASTTEPAVIDSSTDPSSTGTPGDPTSTTVTGATEPTGSDATLAVSTGEPAREPVCGDGIIEGEEECEDQNLDDADACTNACKLARCGDGLVQPGEACDDSGESATCNMNCTPAVCGDQHVNASAGELCDEGGSTPGCDADCTAVACGDGVANAAAGEGCDVGNLAPGDACSSTCAPTKLVDMSLGHRHTCALFEDGAVRCWGAASDGQLGQGNVAPLGDQAMELPPPDVNTGAKMLQIAGGERHTCAVTTDQTVRCWGYGKYGQLGYGNADQINAPNLKDVPGITGVEQLGVGSFASCALQQGGAVRCWGDNTFGILGSEVPAAIGDNPGELPPPAIDLGGPATELAVGYAHACALMQAGKVRCWGWGNYGQLGSGGTSDVGNGADQMPPKDVVLGGAATQVVAGQQHSCALLATGKVRCWGRGDQGSLGYGEKLHIALIGDFPPKDVDLGGDAKRLWSHLSAHTCAQLVDDTLRCWGLNDFGQLGLGHTDNIGDDESPASSGPVPY